jgi:hypothetical protein
MDNITKKLVHCILNEIYGFSRPVNDFETNKKILHAEISPYSEDSQRGVHGIAMNLIKRQADGLDPQSQLHIADGAREGTLKRDRPTDTLIPDSDRRIHPDDMFHEIHPAMLQHVGSALTPEAQNLIAQHAADHGTKLIDQSKEEITKINAAGESNRRRLSMSPRMNPVGWEFEHTRDPELVKQTLNNHNQAIQQHTSRMHDTFSSLIKTFGENLDSQAKGVINQYGTDEHRKALGLIGDNS